MFRKRKNGCGKISHTKLIKMKETVEEWCESIAMLIIDALVDEAIIKKEDFDKAAAIASEEILIRLNLEDFPQSNNLPKSGKTNDKI